MSGRLAGKSAIVTGAACGLGLATAKRFSVEGAQLLLTDEDENAVRNAAAKLGGSVIAVGADVTDPAGAARIVAAAKEAFGRIDVFVHHGEIRLKHEKESIAFADWELVLRVNLTGTFLVAQAVAREMIGRGSGSIVLTAATEYLGSAREPDYAASKGGVVSLMRSLALELAPHNIRVNALAPGPIVEEVAAGALFLASDESALVNGHLLYVDGGASADARR